MTVSETSGTTLHAVHRNDKTEKFIVIFVILSETGLVKVQLFS